MTELEKSIINLAISFLDMAQEEQYSWYADHDRMFAKTLLITLLNEVKDGGSEVDQTVN